MLKKAEDTVVPASKGLNTVYNILSLEKDQTPNCMDVIINYDGSVEERMGTNTQNAVIIAASAAAGFTTNSTGTIGNNLSSYWKLEEASGSRADLNGVVTLLDSGGVGQVSGIKNNAALFSASTGQALYATNPSTLTNNQKFSISSWIYLNSTSKTAQRTIVSKRDQAGGSPGLVTLLHMDGADQSTTFTDSESTPKTWTASGNAKIVTAQSKFGGASGSFDGSNSYISTTSNTSDFAFGTADFTIDFWVNFNSLSGTQNIFSCDNTRIQVGIDTAGTNISVGILGTFYNFSFSFSTGTWYHFAITRNGANLRAFVNGNQAGTTQSDSQNITAITIAAVGANSVAANFTNGFIDEFRVLSGTAAWTANFTPPTSAYTNPSAASEYEYWLYVDTDNQINFNVSSSGIVAEGTITATSFGALTTATWYNVVAWFDGNSNNQIGLSVNLATNSGSYTKGILTGSAPFTLGAISNGAGSFMDGRIDETGYWSRILTRGERQDLYNGGSGNTYSNAFDTQTWASFDFGASSIRWLTVAAGTGLYASSNLGVTFVNIATDRTANYQYLDRSKNVLVATSDSYDTPLYWSGSAGSFAATLNTNAAACKFSINFQGFLILLNSSTRKRGFFYNDENTQLTGSWTNSFDLPSSADDEITAVFVLRRYLYISTRYKLFRVNYVGGNPDWQFLELKNWGFIPRTVKKLVLTNQTPGVGLYYSIGEIAIGLTWDRKLRVFDGSNDQIISNPIEKDNNQCDFALNKISYSGSGPVISFGEVDPNENVYHLCLAVGAQSSRTTHFLNYDGRAFAFYPWSNMPYNTMCMAESANQRFLMAFDRSGYCHMMNSGTLDANKTLIDGVFDSPLMFNKTPSQSTKGHKTDLFFTNNSGGNLIYSDRVDALNAFIPKRTFSIPGSTPNIVHYESIDAPEMYNMYQFRIAHNTSSNNSTFQPWRLMRYDHFHAGLGIGKNN